MAKSTKNSGLFNTRAYQYMLLSFTHSQCSSQVPVTFARRDELHKSPSKP